MEEGAPHDGNAHSGAYARGRSRGLRLPKCRDSGRPPFPQAHGVFSSLRGGSSRSRRSRSVQSLLLPRPDGFSLGRSRRHAASPLRIFLKAQGFKPFPQTSRVFLSQRPFLQGCSAHSRRRTASFRTGRQQPAPARFHRLRRVRGMGGKWLRERGPNQLRTMRGFRGTKTIPDAARGDGRMRPISRSIRFPHPGKSYQSENARQAFLFKQAVFSG